MDLDRSLQASTSLTVPSDVIEAWRCGPHMFTKGLIILSTCETTVDVQQMVKKSNVAMVLIVEETMRLKAGQVER